MVHKQKSLIPFDIGAVNSDTGGGVGRDKQPPDKEFIL